MNGVKQPTIKTYRATVAEESLKNADEGRLKIPAILMLANEENEKKKKTNRSHVYVHALHVVKKQNNLLVIT